VLDLDVGLLLRHHRQRGILLPVRFRRLLRLLGEQHKADPSRHEQQEHPNLETFENGHGYKLRSFPGGQVQNLKHFTDCKPRMKKAPARPVRRAGVKRRRTGI